MYARTQSQQIQLKAEFEKENRAEWTEQQPGQPEILFHSNYMHFYGVGKMNCAHCGRTFYCDSGSYHNGVKYCSDRCINRAYIARRKMRRQAERRKTCPVCGKSFDAARKDTRFCSSACKQKNYRERKLNRNEPYHETVPAQGSQ